jgi:hypothetical protein
VSEDITEYLSSIEVEIRQIGKYLDRIACALIVRNDLLKESNDLQRASTEAHNAYLKTHEAHMDDALARFNEGIEKAVRP